MEVVENGNGVAHEITAITKTLAEEQNKNPKYEFIEELEALTSEDLSFAGDFDELPQFEIRDFRIVTDSHEEITLDCGLLEEGQDIYALGYVYQLLGSNSSQNALQKESNNNNNNNINDNDNADNKQSSLLTDGNLHNDKQKKVVRIGPIDEWYAHGFDGGLNALININTPYASYILRNCAQDHVDKYSPFLLRIMVLKYIFECLADNYEIQYEEMCNYVMSCVSVWARDKVIL